MDESFAEVYELHVSGIYLFVRQFMGDDETAEDLTADTFVRAYHSWSQLLRAERVRSWLFRIAYNLCVDRLRRSQRLQIVSFSHSDEEDTAPLLLRLESSAPSPSDAVAQHEPSGLGSDQGCSGTRLGLHEG